MINNRLVFCYDLKKRFPTMNLNAVFPVVVPMLPMLKGPTLILNISKSARVISWKFRTRMGIGKRNVCSKFQKVPKKHVF